MRSSTQQLLALAMVGMMLLSGCAGWGTDGPADDGDSENDTSDDLADEQNQSQNQSDGDSDGSDSGTSTGDSTNDTGSDSDSESDASSDSSRSSSSDSAADSSDDSSDSSDCSTGDCPDQSDDTGDSTDGSSDSDSDDSDGNSTDGDDGTDGTDGDDGDDTADPATHELTVIVENHNGEPVEGASVSVATADDGDEVVSGETDSDGIATFSVESGEYDIIADHEDALGDGGNRVTVDGDTEASVKLDTSDGKATGKVIVVDQNGDPVEGEPVILSPPGTVDEEGKITEHTNEDGEVIIELSAGDPSDAVMYGVEVRDQEKTLAIMADAYTGVQEAKFEVDTTEVEETERTLTVTVVDQNGDPLEGAEIRGRGPILSNGDDHHASGETNATGVATMTAYDGEYDLKVEYGGTVTEDGVTVDGDTETTVEVETDPDPSGETHELTVSVETPDGEPAKNIPVEVVTHEGGEPVATGTTGENGNAVFSLEDGGYEILVDVSDTPYTHYGTFLVGIDGEDKTYPIPLSPTPGGPADTRELKVTVTDPNGDPVEGASVSIVTYDGGADVASGMTNSDGVATFNVPNGEYEAVVTTEDDDLIQPSDQRLVTVNDSDANLDVQMQSSGDTGTGNGDEPHTLTVHAESAVTLESTDEDGMSETKEPEDGVVTFEVPTGSYMLSAEGYP